jgi:putative ABC transport system permease protein
MRKIDIVGLALTALLQRRTRTALTLLGIVVGACLLVGSLAAFRGVHIAIENQFGGSGQQQRIHISADYRDREEAIEKVIVEGNVSDERRERLKKELAKHTPHRERIPTAPITPELLTRVSEIDHVDYVWPYLEKHWQLYWGEHEMHHRTMAAITGPQGIEHLIVAGRGFNSDNEKAVLVHEYFVYDWGFHDDSQVEKFLGETIRVENYHQSKQAAGFFDHFSGSEFSVTEKVLLGSLLVQFPELVDQLDVSADSRELLKRAFTPESKEGFDLVEVSEEYAIVGIFRSPTEEEEKRLPWDWKWRSTALVLPVKTAIALNSKLSGREQFWIDSAYVKADAYETVRDVVDSLEAMGVKTRSMVEFLEHILRNLALIMWGMTGFAAAALLVAAIGITNTMVMAVLERTREIGIMKAVGASEGQIMSIFLIEGMLLGLAGGTLGVFSGWGISLGMDSWVPSILEGEFHETISEPMFVFPAWLALSGPLFCGIVTTAAAFYPARRAARIDPVQALRHD